MLGFPLGILSAAGAGGVAAGSYDLIQTYIPSSSASTLSFTGLATYASTYKHLQVRMTLRSTQASTSTGLLLRLNGNSSNSYSMHHLVGNGSSVSSTGYTSQQHIYMTEIDANNITANVFSPVVVDFLDIYSSTKNKTMRISKGYTGNVEFQSGAWLNTSAATSIDFLLTAANFAIGSRFSLYGIKG